MRPSNNGSLLARPLFSRRYSIIIWSIWKERISRIFRNISCTYDQIHDLVLTRLSWWIKGWEPPSHILARKLSKTLSLFLSWSEPRALLAMIVSNSDKSWSPPPKNFFKWNVDASVNSSKSMSAIGGALRND